MGLGCGHTFWGGCPQTTQCRYTEVFETHDPEIKSRTLHQQNQLSALIAPIFNMQYD